MNRNVNHARGIAAALQAIGSTVEQTYHQEKTLHGLTHKVAKNKVEIKKALGTKDSASFKNAEGNEFLVSRKDSAVITFDAVKAKEKLDPKRFKAISNQKLMINDYAALIDLLKDYGVPPKEFKQFVEAEFTIDAEKLDHLLELEEITVEEIKEFSHAEFEDEIKIRKVK